MRERWCTMTAIASSSSSFKTLHCNMSMRTWDKCSPLICVHPMPLHEPCIIPDRYFRPSFTRTSNVFCLGAVESKGQGALRFQECNDSERQQWVLMRDPKSDARAVTPWWYGLRNVALKTCVRLLAPTSDTEPVRVGLDDCASVHGSRNTSAMRWRLDPPRYVGANAAILPNMIA